MIWSTPRVVHASAAQMPGLRFIEAVTALHAGIAEDFGVLSTAHCQLCPQNFGELGDEVVDELLTRFSATQFRLHANVRVPGHGRAFDASTQGETACRYFKEVARVSARLGASAYTLHAGERSRSTLDDAIRFAAQLEDLFGHRVGIEGMYPEAGRKWLVDSWDEYRLLMDSGAAYCLDLSHLHILSVRSRTRDMGLVRDLLAHPNAIEVHLSANCGTSDDHVPMRGLPTPWWAAALNALNDGAVMFSEGNERRGPAATERVISRIKGVKG